MKQKRVLKLFLSMLSISSVTFGGGFVIVSFMKKRFVDEMNWLTEDEMLDMTALAQSAPGPIALNAAILVGRRAAGIPGMIAAAMGTLIPPLVIIGVLSVIYARFASNEWVRAAMAGMSCGVAAVICDVVFGLGEKVIRSREPVKILLMILSFVLALVGVNVIYIILLATVAGILSAFVIKKGGEKNAV